MLSVFKNMNTMGGYVYCNKVPSMKESHDWQLGGGRGRQRREDIEKEAVLADGLGAEEVGSG